MATMRHQNVVAFLGTCYPPPCIITEFCAMGSLDTVLRRAKTDPAFARELPWNRRLGIAVDAAKGMHFLHTCTPPILHRDFKSPNLLVDANWCAKVADFNLSKRETPGMSHAGTLTKNNPRWLAPEMLAGDIPTKAADVFSFGVVMWVSCWRGGRAPPQAGRCPGAMLAVCARVRHFILLLQELMTWELPWPGRNSFQIMALMIGRKRMEVPTAADLPGGGFTGMEAYVALMERCWSESPADRPTFEEVVAALRWVC